MWDEKEKYLRKRKKRENFQKSRHHNFCYEHIIYQLHNTATTRAKEWRIQVRWVSKQLVSLESFYLCRDVTNSDTLRATIVNGFRVFHRLFRFSRKERKQITKRKIERQETKNEEKKVFGYYQICVMINWVNYIVRRESNKCWVETFSSSNFSLISSSNN